MFVLVYRCLILNSANNYLALTHPGVKCAQYVYLMMNFSVLTFSHLCSCLLDIVGARFHCAICDSVDICSHCESAGLPGNLDSSDGGHNSSHILIKVSHEWLSLSYISHFILIQIPYPLETNEVGWPQIETFNTDGLI